MQDIWTAQKKNKAADIKKTSPKSEVFFYSLYFFYKIFIENNAFADVFKRDIFVGAVDGGKLSTTQIDGSKAKNVFRNVGKSSGIGSGS